MRFYAELNDFLPRGLRAHAFDHAVSPRAPIRDIVEGLGVPHTEVDLVLVNGESVSLEHVPPDGASVSVYPVFEALDIAGATRVRPEPLRQPRFVLDVHLGRLCAYLRMAGFDTRYSTRAEDDELAAISARERRILLTRDQGLLKRKMVTHAHWVRHTAPRQQLHEVIDRFDLRARLAPFTRCLRCNARLHPLDQALARERVPPRAWHARTEFQECPSCRRVFWKGTHYERMLDLLAQADPHLAAIDWATWVPRDTATLVFVVREGQVLLIRKKRGLGAGKINGPGGRLDPGETPAACAAREVAEELRVQPVGLRAFGELRFQFVDGYAIHVHVFRADDILGTPTETDEAAPLWVPVSGIPYEEMWADDRSWLPHLLAGRHFEGWFVFDGDRMLAQRVTTPPHVERTADS